MANYQTAPGLRWSVLSAGLVSGLELAHQLQNPRQDTASMSKGRAAHVATLTPELLTTWPTVPPEFLTPSGNVSTKPDAKAWLSTMAQLGIEPLGAADVASAKAMATAINAHPISSETLGLCPDREFAVYATDAALGPVKAQADFYNRKTGCGGDLKSNGDRSKGRFDVRSCLSILVRRDYAAQLAWYRYVFELAGYTFDDWRIIWVDANAPHDVLVMTLGPSWQEYGQRRMEEAVSVYMDVKAGRIYGCAHQLVAPTLPDYLIDDFEGELQELEGIDE